MADSLYFFSLQSGFTLGKWLLSFAQDSSKLSSVLTCFGDQITNKNTKTCIKWLKSLSRVLNMPIELKGLNYYSKVFKRIYYRLSNSTFWVVITHQQRKHQQRAPSAHLKRATWSASNGADEAPKRHCNDAITTPGVTTWKRCFHDHQIGAMPPALQRIWRCLQQRCRWRLNAASKSAWTALLMAPEQCQEWRRSSALNGACNVPPRRVNSAFNVQIILFRIH